MILAIHIIVAISGVLIATLAFLKPAKVSIILSATAGLLTLISGIVLVMTTNTNLIKSCIIGLIYFSIVVYLTVSSRKKLAIEANQ